MHSLFADLQVTSTADLDHRLTRAVDGAIQQAEINGRHGVLVTRHDFSHFTVAISPSVPFRCVKECDLVGRTP
jgi:hypothetical protein